MYIDLYKSVQLSEDAGWVVDSVQLQDNLELSLRSLCQTTTVAQAELSQFLAQRIDDLGGPAAAQYAENGGELGDLSDVMSAERTRALLHYAQKRRTECPFYLQPDSEFAGLESDSERFVALFESQGYGAVLLQNGERALSGGGSVRALLGYGLSPFFTVAVGADLGGSGTLINSDPTSQSDAAEQIDTSLSVAVPIALRFQRFSRLLEIDIAPVLRFDRRAHRFPPGIRATVGLGASTMRKGDFMPYILLWLGAETHWERPGSPASLSLRAGTRVGVDWDL